MAQDPCTVGFVSPGPATWPHYKSLVPLLPGDIRFDYQGLDLYGTALAEIAGKRAEIVARVAALAGERGWSAAVVIGAPTEVYNPGLHGELKSALAIPVTTALAASVAALKVYRASRLLLLTPFEDNLNRLIVAYLSGAGFEVAAPHPFAELRAAESLAPEAVHALAVRCFRENPPGEPAYDAVYFQGAVLDPLPVLERIEHDLDTTAIASNPAMVWDILTQLNRRCAVSGYGRLLAEWPRPAA